jgi:acetoin utilization protein AcuB
MLLQPINPFHRKDDSVKIKELMVPNPITVSPRTEVAKALELMKVNSIRHLPVVSRTKQLKGLLTLADLKQALIPSMLGDLTLADMMIKKPITISPDANIEYAARLIYKYKIGGLPVTRRDQLVGIITETDLLRAFIDMMGLLSRSTWIDVTASEASADLNRCIQIIHQHGAEIINVGMASRENSARTYHFRLSPCNAAPIKKALKTEGFTV